MRIDGENSIQLNHDSGVHDIAITGTNVVPEFSASLVGVVMAAFIGMVVVITRRRFLATWSS